MVEALTAYRRGVAADARVFRRGIPAVKTLQADLRALDIDPERAEAVIDLHALRGTYGTALARSGAPIAEVQRLMRHCDPRLTSRHYVKLGIVDHRAAVARIDMDLSPATSPLS